MGHLDGFGTLIAGIIRQIRQQARRNRWSVATIPSPDEQKIDFPENLVTYWPYFSACTAVFFGTSEGRIDMSGEGNSVLVILAIILVCLFLFGPLEWLVGLFLTATFLAWVVVPVVFVAAFICTFMGRK